MDNNQFKLENMLIRSHSHLRSLKLKAYFKSIEDLNFDGLPKHCVIYSMRRMQDNRYLMFAYNHATIKFESYCVDVETLKAKRLAELDIDNTMNCFIKGKYTIVVRYYGPMTIFKDLREIGKIEFDVKEERCKNGKLLHGRCTQQAGKSVYAVDNSACLYRIEWYNIKDGKYSKTLVKTNVENFYVDKGLGLATLNLDRTLSLPSLTEVDLKAKVDSKAKWTVLTCIAKCWIGCGELDLSGDGRAILASISQLGDIRSTFKLKLTSNGFKGSFGNMFASIYSIHKAYERGRRGILLAFEPDGCCHLISVAYGRMSKLQTIDLIVNKDVVELKQYHVVNCVTASERKGESIVGGRNWSKRINIKLK